MPAQNCRVLVLFASGAVKETEFDTNFGFKLFSDFGFGITHFALLPSLLPGQFIGIIERNVQRNSAYKYESKLKKDTSEYEEKRSVAAHEREVEERKRQEARADAKEKEREAKKEKDK